MPRAYPFTAAALRSLGAAALLLVTLLLPRLSWAAPEDEVEWGLHRVELQRATVVVHSRWYVPSTPEAAIPLAAPLPASAEIDGATPERGEDGEVIALRLPAHASSEPGLTVRIPLAQVLRAEALPVPVPQGSSVHRVVLDPALGFSPDPALGLIAQVGHYAPADIDVVARHRFDSHTDGDLRHVGAFYLRGDDLRGAGSLSGEVSLTRQRMGRAALVAGVLFSVIVLVMVLVYRRLKKQVRYEKAEEFLAQEMESLEAADTALHQGVPGQV